MPTPLGPRTHCRYLSLARRKSVSDGLLPRVGREGIVREERQERADGGGVYSYRAFKIIDSHIPTTPIPSGRRIFTGCWRVPRKVERSARRVVMRARGVCVSWIGCRVGAKVGEGGSGG